MKNELKSWRAESTNTHTHINMMECSYSFSNVLLYVFLSAYCYNNLQQIIKNGGNSKTYAINNVAINFKLVIWEEDGMRMIWICKERKMNRMTEWVEMNSNFHFVHVDRMPDYVKDCPVFVLDSFHHFASLCDFLIHLCDHFIFVLLSESGCWIFFLSSPIPGVDRCRRFCSFFYPSLETWFIHVCISSY